MLNGIAPIIIFEFMYFPPSVPTEGLAETVDSSLSWLMETFGSVPVPIYLDEKLTGIYVESETRAIDIETDIQPQYAKDRVTGLPKPPIVTQRGLSSLVTVNLMASRDSILLNVLLSFADLILSKTVSQEYKISYLNGPTTVFRGLLHGLSTSVGGNSDDLVRITLQLQKPSSLGAIQGATTFVLPRITGALPVGG